MTKRALLTGITGQHGSFLSELLLEKGYEVHGIVRRSSSFNTERLEAIYQDPHVTDYRLRLHYGDLEDGSSLSALIREVQPDEIYNLGAQSHVRVSFDFAEYTVSTIAMGTLRLLEAMRALDNGCRFYQASSSEMFGSSPPYQPGHRTNSPRSSRGLRTHARRCSRISSARTIAVRTGCSSRAASCSTTRVLVGEFRS